MLSFCAYSVAISRRPASGETTTVLAGKCRFNTSQRMDTAVRPSTGIRKKPSIWEACKSIVMTWSVPPSAAGPPPDVRRSVHAGRAACPIARIRNRELRRKCAPLMRASRRRRSRGVPSNVVDRWCCRLDDEDVLVRTVARISTLTSPSGKRSTAASLSAAPAARATAAASVRFAFPPEDRKAFGHQRNGWEDRDRELSSEQVPSGWDRCNNPYVKMRP